MVEVMLSGQILSPGMLSSDDQCPFTDVKSAFRHRFVPQRLR